MSEDGRERGSVLRLDAMMLLVQVSGSVLLLLLRRQYIIHPSVMHYNPCCTSLAVAVHDIVGQL
jgi:hypothetical protein